MQITRAAIAGPGCWMYAGYLAALTVQGPEINQMLCNMPHSQTAMLCLQPMLLGLSQPQQGTSRHSL